MFPAFDDELAAEDDVSVDSGPHEKLSDGFQIYQKKYMEDIGTAPVTNGVIVTNHNTDNTVPSSNEDHLNPVPAVNVIDESEPTIDEKVSSNNEDQTASSIPEDKVISNTDAFNTSVCEEGFHITVPMDEYVQIVHEISKSADI